MELEADLQETIDNIETDHPGYDESKLNKSYTESISVRNLDSLEAAKELLNQGFRPAVLNMASFHTPTPALLA